MRIAGIEGVGGLFGRGFTFEGFRALFELFGVGFLKGDGNICVCIGRN